VLMCKSYTLRPHIGNTCFHEKELEEPIMRHFMETESNGITWNMGR